MVDTSDEWITSRTGIKERRIALEDTQGWIPSLLEGKNSYVGYLIYFEKKHSFGEKFILCRGTMLRARRGRFKTYLRLLGGSWTRGRV